MPTIIHRFLLSMLTCAFVFCTIAQQSLAQSKIPTKIYLIGNSLTNDTVPTALDGNVQWHIDCGKNLVFIHDNPDKPCLKSSKIWTQALKETQFDILVVQPFSGSTLEQDTRVISNWMKMQPGARVILHTGWNRHAVFESDYHATTDSQQSDFKMTYTPVYFDRLIAKLQSQFPTRSIASTQAMQLLDSVAHDIQDKKAPFATFQELYRDDIHMELQSGRFLMHNAMRLALGQPISERGFQLDDEHKKYLRSKLDSVSIQRPSTK
jgi:hypothetical protein